jgi:hypothetical protein
MYHVAVQHNFSSCHHYHTFSYFWADDTGRVSVLSSVMQVKNIAHGPQSHHSKYHATSDRALVARSSLKLDYVPSRQGHTF